MSLGKLERLPEEIRRLIWEHFVVPRTPVPFKTSWTPSRCLFPPSKQSYSSKSERRLAVLEVSKQVHEEVTAELELHRNHHVIFKLYPTKEHIVVSNPCHLEISDFESTDLSQFENVDIIIYPPDTKDPGQLLRLRDFVQILATKMRSSQSLPGVGVVLQETCLAHWHKNGVFNKSISDSPLSLLVREDDLSNDILHVLRPFWVAGKAHIVKVHLPAAAAASETISHEARAVEWLMKYSTPFEESDDHLLNRNKYTTLSLDLALDRLEGPTAAMLRLRRYCDWDTYYDNITHIMGRHESDLTEDFLEALVNRDEARKFFDHNEFNDDCWLVYDNAYDTEENWRALYPAGIPAKHSKEWRECFYDYKRRVDNKRKELGIPGSVLDRCGDRRKELLLLSGSWR
ncbi:hypothetical protein MMC11_001452 [Xylographa trunciseda]|nr:hypothetical protein [Xylographa trunciseda]